MDYTILAIGEFVSSFLIGVITLCADFVVIVCVWKDLKVRSNLVKKLLLLLGIVDLLVSLAVIVRLLLSITTNSFIACIFSLFMEVFLILMHFGVTNLMALERAVSLGAPFWYHRNCDRRILYLCVVFLIVICVPVSVIIPISFSNYIRENIAETTDCITLLLIPSPSMIKVTSVIASMGLFFNFLTLICNCIVLRVISILNRTVHPNFNGRKHQKRFFPAEYQMTKLSVVLCCSYCLFSVPLAIVMALHLLGMSITTTVILKVKHMLMVGFVIDPIIYMAFKKKYRQWVWKACCKVKERIVCHREETSSTVQEIASHVPEKSSPVPEKSSPVSEKY